MIKTVQKITYILWIACVVVFAGFYIIYPHLFTAENLVEFIRSFESKILLVYILLSFIRGFFLIPSTPFVIGGGMLFPYMPTTILIISMLGIVFSATSLYYFSDMLGFSSFLESKYPKQIGVWKKRLQTKSGLYYVTAWSFFPLAPTDLICYVAGIIKMPFKYMILGVFLGELILDIFYIYFSANLFTSVVS